MGYVLLIFVIIFIVVGWGQLLYGIYQIFKPIKDTKGKTIVWEKGKERVEKGYGEVDKFYKDMSKEDRLRNLKKNLNRLEMKKKMELKEKKNKKRKN